MDPNRVRGMSCTPFTSGKTGVIDSPTVDEWYPDVNLEWSDDRQVDQGLFWTSGP